MTTAIRVEEVHKLFRRMAPGFQLRTLKSALLDRSLIRGLRPEDTIPALNGVSFEVQAGEAFGVIGRNGSGKSTLLKLLVGMLKPTTGRIDVAGRVAALIELGAGFHPEISGRENVYINGAVLGMSRREIDERYDAIVEFSGLADFIDEPVKNYSSGMYVRLGFAVAIHTEPDVLLVDEVLAVGDESFTHRCLRRIEDFLARGKTLLLVSHSLGMIEEYCDRVLWLDGGECRLLGAPRFVVDAYRKAVAEEEGRGHQEAKEERARALESAESAQPPTEAATADESDGAEEAEPAAAATEPEEVLRWGSREAEVTAVRLLDSERRERYYFDSGEEVCFEIEVEASRPLTDVVFGVGLFTPRGIECWGTNTSLEGYASEGLDSLATARVICPALRLAPGEYLLDVAVHSREGYPYDYQRRVLSFTVTARADGVGIYFPEHHWEFAGDIRWRERPDE
jgi:ABC-type polysaccharide/polyol phosphate transport system ATPase subunit